MIDLNPGKNPRRYDPPAGRRLNAKSYPTQPENATRFPPFLGSAVDVVLDVLRWHGGRMYLDFARWREFSERGVNRATAERALDDLHSAGTVHVRVVGDLGIIVNLISPPPSAPDVSPPQLNEQVHNRPRFTLARRGGAR